MGFKFVLAWNSILNHLIYHGGKGRGAGTVTSWTEKLFLFHERVRVKTASKTVQHPRSEVAVILLTIKSCFNSFIYSRPFMIFFFFNILLNVISVYLPISLPFIYSFVHLFFFLFSFFFFFGSGGGWFYFCFLIS